MQPFVGSIPEPALDADDAAVPGGDVVALPVTAGAPFSLRFASAYEPWLALRGTRVDEDRSADERALLVWLHRRLPALQRALGEARGLRGVLAPAGAAAAPSIVVTDVLDADGSWLGHDALLTSLDAARVVLPPFSLLGWSMSKGELAARARSIYAAGTPLELRIEDNRRVIARRRLRVGRA